MSFVNTRQYSIPTFVCPSELHAFQEKLGDFKERGVEVIACSTDTPESHWGWLQVAKDNGGIKGITYPLIADQTKTIASNYGVLFGDYVLNENDELEAEGPMISFRGLFLIDKDGIGEVNVVWKISSDGVTYRNIPGATNQSFTPRQEHVGKTLRVVLTYLDGQGNLETLTSEATTPVVNVNDKPTGVVRLTGESAEDSALILDVSDVYDEDGMGPFNFTWQRTSPNTGWENYTEDDTEVLNLRQEHVSYTYRVRVEYIDGFDTREVIYSNESEAVRNVDDPVLGDVVILGEEKEGSILEARTDSLTDDDGIASIDVAWERSRDGRNWVSLTGENTRSLNLDQTVVGSQVRVKATLVDRFGIETVLHSQPTRIIENVNNVPVGNVLIRRVSN